MGPATYISGSTNWRRQVECAYFDLYQKRRPDGGRKLQDCVFGILAVSDRYGRPAGSNLHTATVGCTAGALAPTAPALSCGSVFQLTVRHHGRNHFRRHVPPRYSRAPTCTDK